MKEVIPKDTRYVPLTQQKSCCMPTCVSIVMLKLKIPLVSQELLGYYLGLTIAKKSKKLFWGARTGKKPKTGYGTRTLEKRYSPDIALKKLGIPLKMINHPLDEFETKNDLISFISEKEKKNEDLITYLQSGTLNNSNKKEGHLCVVDRIYPRKGIIRIIDPSPNQPKWREIKIDNLIKAMKKHPSGMGGMWELKRTRG